MNRYFAGIQKLKQRFNAISRKKKCSRIGLWSAALWDFMLYGVTPNEFTTFAFYEKKHILKKTYYTARHQKRIEAMYNAPENAKYFHDKSLFNQTFAKFVKRKWLLCSEHSAEEIEDFIRQNEVILVKPIGLSSGNGIYQLDKNSYNVHELKQKGYLLEERLFNHDAIRSFSPGALCTVRIYTVLGRDGKVHWLSTLLRMGGKIDAVVDNYHSGGFYARIDEYLGRLMTKGKGIDGEMHEHHPLSGQRFVGFQLPNWEMVREAVEEVAHYLPQSRFIGWDVAILQDRVELIEGNYIADPGLMQSLDIGGQLIQLKELY